MAKDWSEAFTAGQPPREAADAAWPRGDSDPPSPDNDKDPKPWPIMESKAMYGIVGEIAELATASSEADPAAVIATALVYASAEFGRSQVIRIGDDVHHSRHFAGIVGASARGRKGTRAQATRPCGASSRPPRRYAAAFQLLT